MTACMRVIEFIVHIKKLCTHSDEQSLRIQCQIYLAKPFSSIVHAFCGLITTFVNAFRVSYRGNVPGERPYESGQPCSNCPPDMPVCVNNACCKCHTKCYGNTCT